MRHLFYSFLVYVFFIGRFWCGEYSALVMDVYSGKILHSHNSHQKRFPASLTKKMTLYLVFKALKSGKITLNTRFRVSSYAASREPSKLWLKAGSYVEVKDLVLGLITKSANDAATVIAEGLNCSEKAFARLMTQTAKLLGMKNTTFFNPSGLPHPHHISTAYDMALLGKALYHHFPRWYKFFRTKIFYFQGKRFQNTNRLLGRVKGMDGIKTGYTRAARFNLTACARRGKQRLLVVVMGAPTRLWRDQHVAQLFEQYFAKKMKEHEYHDVLKLLYEDELLGDTEALDSLIEEEKKTDVPPPVVMKNAAKKNDKASDKKAQKETLKKNSSLFSPLEDIVRESAAEPTLESLVRSQ